MKANVLFDIIDSEIAKDTPDLEILEKCHKLIKEEESVKPNSESESNSLIKELTFDKKKGDLL